MINIKYELSNGNTFETIDNAENKRSLRGQKQIDKMSAYISFESEAYKKYQEYNKKPWLMFDKPLPCCLKLRLWVFCKLDSIIWHFKDPYRVLRRHIKRR